MKEIYLDNAAATRPAATVAAVLARCRAQYANPSSFNDAGRRAAAALTDARTRIARFLNARADEVVLCASGSEANTLALLGAANARKRKGSILVAETEHRSVLEPIHRLATQGFRTVTIPVDGEGRIDPNDIIQRLSPTTVLVSVMYANNEIGTIQPIARIGQHIMRWRRERGSRYPLFHVDACQATTVLPMDVQRLGADLLTFNGTKAYGPHGVAVLYVRRGIVIDPLVLGGGQEGGRRAGTEDVVSAAALAAALETIRPAQSRRIQVLRDRLIAGVLQAIPDARLNGPAGDERLAGNVSISIPDCDSERLLLELDRYGIRAGSGSACTAHSVQPSHVLAAIGTPRRYLKGVIRFSLGRETTRAHIDRVIAVLPSVIARARG